MWTKTAIAAATLAISAGAAHAQSANTNTQTSTSATAAIVNNTPGGGSDLSEQVPPVYAPGLDSGTNKCAVSASAGGAASGFGLVLGGSFENEDCQRRNWFVLISRAGQPQVAKALACENEQVRRAYELAGKPCPQTKRRRRQAKANNAPEGAPPYCDDGGWATDETIRENCPNASALLN